MSITPPRRQRLDSETRFLLTYGLACVVIGVAIQAHRHELPISIHRTTATVTTTGAATTHHQEVRPARPHPHHRGGHAAARGSRCALRNHDAARVRAHADDRPLALQDGMAGARCDRHARIELGSVRVVPRPARLLVRGLELVRDTAGESLSARVARATLVDVADAGAMARRLRGIAVRVAVAGARLSSRARLVLTAGGRDWSAWSTSRMCR